MATRQRGRWSWSRHAGGGRGRSRNMLKEVVVVVMWPWQHAGGGRRRRRRRDVAIMTAARCCSTYPPSQSPHCPLTPLFIPACFRSPLPALVHPCQPALVPAPITPVRARLWSWLFRACLGPSTILHSRSCLFTLVCACWHSSPFSTYQN